MKIIYAFVITASLSMNPMLVFAEDPAGTNTLIANLGAYLGFDIVTTMEKEPYSALLDSTGSAIAQQSALLTLFGALPVNAVSEELSAFVPSSISSASSLNGMSNYTFESANYNTASTKGSITVNALLDQQSYQNDPINQAMLNILGTPDYSFCMNNDGSAWLTDCAYLYNLSVLNSTVGTLPKPSDFFSYAYNQNVIPQLNSNTLIAPLLYTTSVAPPSGSSTENANQPTNSSASGLSASTQAQEAANFIRYATFGVSPLNLPTLKNYSDTYITATSPDPTTTVADKTSAQNALTSYISNIRTYAAQASVPISNLYYIFSKRMPQQSGTNTTTQTSQALSEFQMATRRIYSTNSQQGTQWIDQINAASPATVEKEIAILLSEINYQLYLNRQQEERQLLTSSLMLLLAARQQAPDFNNTISNVTAETTTDASTTPTEPTTDAPAPSTP